MSRHVPRSPKLSRETDIRKTTILKMILLLATCGAARAQLDVDLAFDPSEVYAGDTLHASASVANLGDVDVEADVATLVVHAAPDGTAHPLRTSL